ncbi:hypothetical protein HNY73_004813 [Argiope bruennichi]|uniref:Uncharacterized protein n=1 Tax=Argiope bruennichi TaxID=94029 RepID=A0A8T0FUT6_ARGBR|nr:hypothetical protein HNY73_004813 [Argiope bruennichi]
MRTKKRDALRMQRTSSGGCVVASSEQTSEQPPRSPGPQYIFHLSPATPTIAVSTEELQKSLMSPLA